MLAKFWNDESGASAAEYALILAIVGSAIALSVTNLGTDISEVMDRAGDIMDGTLPAVPATR